MNPEEESAPAAGGADAVPGGAGGQPEAEGPAKDEGEREGEARAEVPQPPQAPAKRDEQLEQLRAGPTEAEQHTQRKSHVAPAMVPLDRVDEDATFRMREVGDLSALATDMARLGQLFPVELRLRAPDRFQVICGFRRVAALRLLQRDRVLARLHLDLSDEDALLMALASAIHGSAVARADLEAARQKLGAEGRLSPAARDMLDKALQVEGGLSPESAEEEVDADELAEDVTLRLGEINQDLGLLADVFADLDDERKQELLKQLEYSAELVAYLEGR